MIANLTASIRAFEQGDPQGVLHDQGLTDIAELWRLTMTPEGTVPDSVVQVVTRVHSCRHRYAALLLQKLMHSDDPAGLTLAIDVLSVPIPEPLMDVERGARLSNLGAALQTRFKRAGSIADLDQAINVGSLAVSATPRGDRNLASRLTNLSAALQNRFKLAGDVADLDRAVECGRRAVGDTPSEHPNIGSMLATLGAALQLRFVRTGVLADVDEAIEVGRRAVTATPPGTINLASRLSSLGTALVTRFKYSADVEDLDQAVNVARRAAEATPPGHPTLGAVLSNLGNTLHTRFNRVSSTNDLMEAVDIGRRAVEATPADGPQLAVRLSNFASALHSWPRPIETPYELIRPADALPARRLLRYDADLELAITLSRRVVEIASADHPEWAMFLSNLGNALGSRFDRLGSMTDLDEAIIFGHHAIEAAPAGHPGLSSYRSNLGYRLLIRFIQIGDLADLDNAVAVSRQAVDATPAGHPALAARLVGLGAALYARSKHVDLTSDLDQSLEAWEQATASTVAPVYVRLDAARRRADATMLIGDTGRALASYTTAVDLVLPLAWRGLSRSDQRFQLQESTASLGPDAAACAVADGEPGAGVELLEQGRGVLWSQLLDGRADLSGLEQSHPDLAAALVRCRNQLDHSQALEAFPLDAFSQEAPWAP